MHKKRKDKRGTSTIHYAILYETFGVVVPPGSKYTAAQRHMQEQDFMKRKGQWLCLLLITSTMNHVWNGVQGLKPCFLGQNGAHRPNTKLQILQTHKGEQTVSDNHLTGNTYIPK